MRDPPSTGLVANPVLAVCPGRSAPSFRGRAANILANADQARDLGSYEKTGVSGRNNPSANKGEANYWRQLHRKARERAANWQAKYEAKCAEPSERKLAEGERALGRQARRVTDLEGQVELLEQEKVGLEQRNRDLLKKPFGMRSERRGAGSGRGAESDRGRAGTGKAGGRQRGGQPGRVAHGRVERSGLAVREEVVEPDAASCRCPECGREYQRNGEEISERIEVEVSGVVARIIPACNSQIPPAVGGQVFSL